MKFESFFRPKPKQELEEQVQTIEEKNNIKLTHESIKDEVGLLEVSELKEKYKVRYDAYLEMLRAERQGADLQESDFYKAKVLINAFNNLDDYILAQERGEHRVLRGRQIPVFNEIRDALERGVDAGYVHLPTGVGKTVLFTQLIEATKLRTLIGVPSIPLVRNTVEEIGERTTRSSGEYTRKQKDTSQNITTITYKSLINAVREEKITKEDFPLIILDEAHKALGPETEKAINSLSGIKIGFTATPEYSPDRGVGELLPEEIYTMTLREAIEEGLSCRTKTIHAYTKVDMSSVSIQNGRYNDEELEKVLNVKGRNMAALELYKNKFSHLKAMVNCSGIKHSKAVAELFQEQGIKAAHIDGTMNDKERDDIIAKLETGEIMVVTNAKLLLEGFDEQSLAVALNLSPTLSFVNAEQRGGRPLRIEEGNYDKWAYVVDFIDKNAKKNQILFSEILEGDKITPIEEEKIEASEKREIENKELEREPPINFDDLNIDGLRVVVDTKEILEVTKQFEESREIKEWKYKSLREDVLAKGINSASGYANNSSKYGWPVPRTLHRMPEFPKNPDGSNDWDTFFDREKRKEWTYETLREDLLAKEIKSSRDYEKKQKDNQWPVSGTLTSMPEFPKNPDGSNDWDTFLVREKKKWQTYSELREEIVSKGITSSVKYANAARINKWPAPLTLTSMPEFPKNPDGSNDWDTFLGREKFDFSKFREEVLAKGIRSTNEYREFAVANSWLNPLALTNKPEFPKNPDGSNDWDTFLGREKRKEWTYESLRKDILSKNIKSSKDFSENREYGWPSHNILTNMPEFPKNPDGSNDWRTFLGREKRKEWTYETLRQDVMAKGVKSTSEYVIKRKDNEWLDSETLTNKPEFPKNPDGSNDWDTFLGREKRKEWTYESLRDDVRKKGIKSASEYKKYRKINQWPDPGRTLRNFIGTPLTLDGSVDWSIFLGL